MFKSLCTSPDQMTQKFYVKRSIQKLIKTINFNDNSNINLHQIHFKIFCKNHVYKAIYTACSTPVPTPSSTPRSTPTYTKFRQIAKMKVINSDLKINFFLSR